MNYNMSKLQCGTDISFPKFLLSSFLGQKQSRKHISKSNKSKFDLAIKKMVYLFILNENLVYIDFHLIETHKWYTHSISPKNYHTICLLQAKRNNKQIWDSHIWDRTYQANHRRFLIAYISESIIQNNKKQIYCSNHLQCILQN